MILEVNASPSMTANTPADYALKYGLLNDTLDIVDMESKCVRVLALCSQRLLLSVFRFSFAFIFSDHVMCLSSDFVRLFVHTGCPVTKFSLAASI